MTKTELPCGHLFDMNCIEKWIMTQSTKKRIVCCPVCRKVI